jgi:hypothetical protein
MVQQRFNKRIKHMVRFLKYTLLTFVCISASLFASGVQAADPPLGDFKCPMFAVEGKKLSIFLLTLVEGADAAVEVPQSDRFFCVETNAASTTVTWGDLTKGKDRNGAIAIKPQWGGGGADVRPQYFTTCLLQTSDIWNDTGVGADVEPSDQIYSLSRTALRCNKPDARLRYYLNELVGSPELYLYYIKPALRDEQQENPIAACEASRGTSKQVCEANPKCFWSVPNLCMAKADPGIDCTKLSSAECSSANYCTTGENNTCVKKTTQVEVSKAIDQYIEDRYAKPKDYTGPLPECAFTGSCRNVEDLVELGVNIATWLFGIIAGLGFAFFVYGGLTMVLSFGNSEKVGQGKQILVAATVGMIIAFSAYVLVSFVVKAIGINPNLVPF